MILALKLGIATLRAPPMTTGSSPMAVLLLKPVTLESEVIFGRNDNPHFGVITIVQNRYSYLYL